jgi:hypothetical protein
MSKSFWENMVCLGMIKVLAAASALVLIASLVTAQTIIDGSGADIPSEERRVVLEFLTADFNDPASAQIRRFHRAKKPHRWCGEVNGKNLYNAYTGFRHFLVVMAPEIHSVTIAKPRDTTAVTAAELDLHFTVAHYAGCNVPLPK